jgi:pimeloyl-ACP methyl ester carboxylesterase
VLLIPGLLCDAAAWEHQRAALSPQYPVVIAEHGLSDTLPQMAQRALRQCSGPLAVAGHSMGGRVALEMLRAAPERIKGLALLDTGLHALAAGEAGERERAGRMRLLDIARTRGMRAMAQVWVQDMVHPDRRGDAPLIDAILDMFERRTPEHFAAQIDALLQRPECGDLLPRFTGAGLALCGSDDLWAPVAAHREMANLMPRSELVVVAHCGHMSTMERPETITQALSAWLQRVPV